ncbi:MAG TPA: cbb3-type cytochrome c oxidase subunit II [Chitinophagaceae bacterium]|nr:cytochrome c [Chitinophagaceae bacterium]HNJ58658.1 cbb3-type cytochrome c oxidase subunit II [Chitinophagaceae bacterium]
MNIFNNHTKLYTTAAIMYFVLTFFTAIKPALDNQQNNGPLPGTKPLSGDALAGKMVYIAEGCVACHTQQVRNVDMDKMFGTRPGIPSDYANIGRTSVWQNTATLMGTERTGPDLTDVGNRQPSKEWNLLHLYNPRSVVAQSIMPSYKWLFEIKENPSKNDVIVNVPAEFMHGKTGKVVATKKALQLVAYLQSLKQTSLPESIKPYEFLYKQEKKVTANAGASEEETVDGKALFTANCQSCHQANGEGLKGAFPSLKGSPIVLGDDLKLIVDIIMNGYDARPEFAVMTPVGTSMNFDEKQVAAIINYIKTSWGNDAKKTKADEVKEIIEFIKTNNPAK